MSQKQTVIENWQGDLLNLWESIQSQTHHATRCGALHPIQTEHEIIEDSGIPFLVRTLSNIGRKEKAQKKQQSHKNISPFLPYEEDLFVTHLSKTHLALLNKYNVVENHLLIVTREFEEQENWLTLEDLKAMWLCLAEVDGLVFYNAGKTAGASQQHKHLQLVPFPLLPTGENLPIEFVLKNAQFEKGVGTVSSFPFSHAIAPLLDKTFRTPSEAAQVTLERYHKLLDILGLRKDKIQNKRQSGAYNFLATRDWMMLIPRTQEKFQSISINSLGFAGTLLVKNSEQMQLIKEQKPMTLLKSVAKIKA